VEALGRAHGTGVEAPLALCQQERVELLAARRTMTAHLVLEVDLAPVPVAAEDDQVAGVGEGVQALELGGQDPRLVEAGEELAGLRTQREALLAGEEATHLSVLYKHAVDPVEAGDAGHQRREAPPDLGPPQAAGQVGEVDVRETARVGDGDLPGRRL